jgi:hypothetical protein
MIVRRILLPAATLLAAAAVAYWALWEFHYSRRDIDPFAPESTYDKFVRVTFGPIRRFERARARCRAIPEGHRTMQGRWEGRIFENGRFADVSMTIDDDIITFVCARKWPELHGKNFLIQTDEEDWDLYFVTELGRTTITPPSDYVRSGEPPDRLMIQAHMDGSWPANPWGWTMQRCTNKANKSE